MNVSVPTEGTTISLFFSPRDCLQVVCLVGSAKHHRQHLRDQQHCGLAGGLLRGQLGTSALHVGLGWVGLGWVGLGGGAG